MIICDSFNHIIKNFMYGKHTTFLLLAQQANICDGFLQEAAGGLDFYDSPCV